ncbi:hypothetical protein PSTT_06264, partial [Puccinia striiformis]
ARATFLFTLSLGQVGLCLPPGQAIHVLDKPAEVISLWSVDDDLTDGLQLSKTEDIQNWPNVDEFAVPIEWFDTEPLQVPTDQAHHSGPEREPLLPLVPFEEAGLERPVDYSEVLTIVNHEGQDVHHPTHSLHPYQVRNKSQMTEYISNSQQGISSCKSKEKLESQSWHLPKSHIQDHPTIQSLPTAHLFPQIHIKQPANHDHCEQHMNHIKDQAIYIENPLLEEYLKSFIKNYADLPFVTKRLPKIQILRTLCLVRPINEKTHKPLNKADTLPMRKFGTRNNESAISNPNGSLPVSGLIGKETYPMDENSFGHVQKALLNFFAKPISKECCITTCISLLKLLTGVPEIETVSPQDSKYQLLQKAINSFNLQKKIEPQIVPTTINGFLLLEINKIWKIIHPKKNWREVSWLTGNAISSMFQKIQECMCVSNEKHTQEKFANLPAHLLSITKNQNVNSNQKLPSNDIVQYIRITDESGERIKPSYLIKRDRLLLSNLVFFHNLLSKYLQEKSNFEESEEKFMNWVMNELSHPKGSLPVFVFLLLWLLLKCLHGYQFFSMVVGSKPAIQMSGALFFQMMSPSVRLFLPTGQPTNVLDKPAEVILTWTVGYEPTDGLQQTGTEDISNWLNMDALDHLIEWHDTEPLQVPSHQAHHSGQEREPLLPLVPPFVESGLDGHLFVTMKDRMFNTQHIPIIPTKSKINHKWQNISQIYKKHMTHIKDQAVSTKREDMEWQDTLCDSLKHVPMRYFKDPILEEHINRIRHEYEALPHSDTSHLVLSVLQMKKSNAPIRKQRFLDHMKHMINWIHFISTLPMRKYGARKDDYTISNQVIDWLIKEIFNPSDSLPILGIVGKSTYPMDESTFGDLQKILIIFFSEAFVKEDCISTCLSALNHHNLDFIYYMPKTEQGYQFTTKDQRTMEAIHSFKLQRRILYACIEKPDFQDWKVKEKLKIPLMPMRR